MPMPNTANVLSNFNCRILELVLTDLNLVGRYYNDAYVTELPVTPS